MLINNAYTKILSIDPILNNNDWKTIKLASITGVAANYWSVGDTKKIVMNGKVSDGLTLTNFETWVFILGFDHNAELEGSGIVFGGFKTAQSNGKDIALVDSGYTAAQTSGQWFNINNTSSNTGGWASSLMRTVTMPLIKAAFPSDLQTVIKTSTIYTDNKGGGSGSVEANVTVTQDEIYLPSVFEMIGQSMNNNTYEAAKQKQYAYYIAGNNQQRFKHSDISTSIYYWTRSCYNRFGTGYIYGSFFQSNNTRTSYGVAPVFRV